MKNITNLFLSALLIFAAHSTFAKSEAVESSVLEQPIAFNTLDEAAVAALKIAAAQSYSIEYGGCLYSVEDKFYFTKPVTNGSEDTFSIACIIPTNSLAGLFHTHPSGYMIGISGNDLVVANKLNKTSYVGLLEKVQPRVVKYIPKKTRTECISSSRLGCHEGERYSPGEFVSPL